MQSTIHRGRRLFAVPKKLSLTDRVANTTQCPGNWHKVMTHHATARVVLNYHKR